MTFDHSSSIFHIGILVRDMQASCTELGESMGVTWTDVVTRTDQRIWTPEHGQRTVPLTFVYSREAPQHLGRQAGCSNQIAANQQQQEQPSR